MLKSRIKDYENINKFEDFEQPTPKKSVKTVQNTILDQYMKELSSYPLLKSSEITELFQKYEEGKSIVNSTTVLTEEAKRIKNKIIQANLRLVISIAKNYAYSKVSIEDLIQEGNIGLIKSIDKFSWSKGHMFSTYATWWIKQSIGQFFIKKQMTIRLPAHAIDAKRKIGLIIEEYKKNFGHEPNVSEISELIGTSEKIVRATLTSSKMILSINDTLSSNGKSNNKFGHKETYEDVIGDPNPNNNPYNAIVKKEIVRSIKNSMKDLTKKEYGIMCLRLGLQEDPTDHKNFPITNSELEDVILNKKSLQ